MVQKDITEMDDKKQNEDRQKHSPQNLNYYNVLYQQSPEQIKNEKLNKFKTRLEAFKRIKSLKEAKNLLDKTMPVQLERTVFYIGDAKCTIINKQDLLKISFKSKTEIIILNFQ
jgi:hypothetical protein